MADEINYDGWVLTPAWHQGNSYNMYCPWNFSTGSRSVTGCVATAAAEVAWSWLNRNYTDEITITVKDDWAYTYPSAYTDIRYTIDGSVENAEKFGYLQWDELNKILAAESIYSIEYIAALNFAAGIYHWMVYDDWGGVAGALPNEYFFSTIGMNHANADMWGNTVDWHEETNSLIITDGFYEVLIDNLLAGCPVIAVNEDHAYVIDGYNSKNDTFHVNWGDGTGGVWHSRTSLNSLGNEGFYYDIMPKNYMDFDLTVTNTRIYGRGTFERVFELANIHSGHDTISFAENIQCGVGDSDSEDDNYLFLQTYESLTIDSMYVDLQKENIVFYAKNKNLREEDVISFSMNNFSGTLISQYLFSYSIIDAQKLSLDMDNGAIVLKSNYFSEIDIQKVLDFKERGFEAAKEHNFYFFNKDLLPFSSSGEAISSENYDDIVTLDNRSLVIGGIELGDGKNILQLSNGSLITGADYINMGVGSSSIIIDSSSKIAVDKIKGNANITYVINDIVDDAIIMTDYWFSYDTINIDAIHAQNGTYILLSGQNGIFDEVVVKDKDSIFTLKNGETKGNFTLTVRKELNKSYVELTVSNYTYDTVAPTAVSDIKSVAKENYNSVTISWGEGADESCLEGYYVRYGQSTGDLENEVFFAENNGILTNLQNGKYFYQICSVDRSGNRSDWSAENEFVVVITDNEVPEVESVQLTFTENHETHYFNFSVSADIEEECHYRIKTAVMEKGIKYSDMIYSEDEINEVFTYKNIGETFYYSIQAVDNAGNVSEWSDVKSITLTDTSLPGNISITDSDLSSENQFVVKWNTVDDFSFVKYEFEFSESSDFRKVNKYVVEDSTENTFYMPVGEYHWRCRAVDGNGNVSEWTYGDPVKNVYYTVVNQSVASNLKYSADIVIADGVNVYSVDSMAEYLSVTLNGNNNITNDIGGGYIYTTTENGMEVEYIENTTININGNNINIGNINGGNLTVNIADGTENLVFCDYGNSSAIYSRNTLVINGDLSAFIQVKGKSQNGSGYYGISVPRADNQPGSFVLNGDLSGVIQAETAISAKKITINGDITGVVTGNISGNINCSVSGIICGKNIQKRSFEEWQYILAYREEYKDILLAEFGSEETAVVGGESDISVNKNGLILGKISIDGKLTLNDNAEIYGDIYGDLAVSLNDNAKLFGDIDAFAQKLTINSDAYFKGNIEAMYTTGQIEVELLLGGNNLKNCSINLEDTVWYDGYSFVVQTDNMYESGVYKLAAGKQLSEISKIQLVREGDTYTLYNGIATVIDGASYLLRNNGSDITLSVENFVRRDLIAESSEAIEAGKIQISTDGFESYLEFIVEDADGVKLYNYPDLEYRVDGNTENCYLYPVLNSKTSKLVQAESDNNADILFARSYEQWGRSYIAVHRGSKNTWNGTFEKVALTGKNKICDIFVGAEDSNIIYLTDDDNGDAIFKEDIFSDSYKALNQREWALVKSRIYDIDEICAGAGDDVVDMTGQRFEFSGKEMTIRGGSGNDVIWANDAAENILFGDAGDDNIIGGAKNDIFAGGSGNDRLHGGGGRDIFCFGGNFGKDSVEQLAGGSVVLWFESEDVQWNAETNSYTDGVNEVKIIGDFNVEVRYDFNAEFTEAGFFEEYTTDKIFDSSMLSA